MAAKSSCSGEFASSRARVHRDGLADDEAIGDELANGLTGVCVRDFVDFVRVEPDLALAAAGDRRRKALLSAKVHPVSDNSQLATVIECVMVAG